MKSLVAHPASARLPGVGLIVCRRHAACRVRPRASPRAGSGLRFRAAGGAARSGCSHLQPRRQREKRRARRGPRSRKALRPRAHRQRNRRLDRAAHTSSTRRPTTDCRSSPRTIRTIPCRRRESCATTPICTSLPAARPSICTSWHRAQRLSILKRATAEKQAGSSGSGEARQRELRTQRLRRAPRSKTGGWCAMSRAASDGCWRAWSTWTFRSISRNTPKASASSRSSPSTKCRTATRRFRNTSALLTEPHDGLPYDFDQIRVFTWNVRKHRYETAYREHGLDGVLPVTVTQENFDKEGTLPVFILRVKDDAGNVTERKYKLNTPIVRRVLAPGEVPSRPARKRPASQYCALPYPPRRRSTQRMFTSKCHTKPRDYTEFSYSKSKHNTLTAENKMFVNDAVLDCELHCRLVQSCLQCCCYPLFS